jgi:hypothetical protein
MVAPSRARLWEHGRVPDRLRPALGLAVTAVALVLAGCGGSSNSTTTSSSSTQGPKQTKSHFVAQATVICLALENQDNSLRARQEALKGSTAQSADTAFVAIVNQLVADTRAAQSKLRKLPYPAGDGQTIEGLLNALTEEADDATGIAKAASNQESALGETAEKDLKNSVARNSARAAEFGMKGCIGSE